MPASAPTIRFKRGIFTNLPALSAGEPGFTTDKSDLFIGIGGTVGDNKFFGSHRYWQREDGTTSAVLKLVNASDTGSINLKTRDDHTGITTYTFPLDAPIGSGHFLTADSSGNLSWDSVSASATFTDATLSGVTTFSYLTGGNINAGLVTATDYYVGVTTVLSTVGGLVTLSGIATIDSTTKNTLESILRLDPNNFDSLYVSGIGTFTGQLNASGGLDVTGHSELDNVNVSGATTVTSLNATGSVTLGDSNADTLTVNANTTFNSTLTGTISTATRAYTVDTQTSGNSNSSYYLTFVNSNNNSVNAEYVYTDDEIYYNPSSNLFTTNNGLYNGNLEVKGTLTGTATTATKLTNAQNFSITGDFITASTISFDGTGAVALAATITANSIKLGTYTSGDYVASLTAGDGLSGSASGATSTPTLSVNVGAGITISSDNVAFKNAGSLSDNKLMKWDDTNEQLVDTIITDNGTTATVGGNLTVTGDLTINGTTTQVNTTELTVYDRTITLGIQTGATPLDTSWDLGVLMNYGDAGVAKTAGVIWEYGSKRFQFASSSNNPSVGINTTTPNITVGTFAPIEVGGLWVNNSCSGGAAVEVIGCLNSELQLQNIVVDGGSFV
jgi:hypothetical protein